MPTRDMLNWDMRKFQIRILIRSDEFLQENYYIYNFLVDLLSKPVVREQSFSKNLPWLSGNRPAAMFEAKTEN